MVDSDKLFPFDLHIITFDHLLYTAIENVMPRDAYLLLYVPTCSTSKHNILIDIVKNSDN